MSRSLKVNSFPTEVKEQLQKNRSEFPGWSIDDHVAALKELGQDVSRSSLHRWMTENPLPVGPNPESVRARTTALEAATLVFEGDKKEELLALAESLLQWIYTDQK